MAPVLISQQSTVLREVFSNLILACAAADTPVPYFVFSLSSPLSEEAAHAFARQVLKSFRSIHSAFSRDQTRSSLRAAAVKNFISVAPSVSICSDLTLDLVREPPPTPPPPLS